MSDLLKPTNPGTAVILTSTVQTPTVDLAKPSAPVGSRVQNFGPDHPKFADWLFLAEEPGTKEPEQFYEQPFKMVAFVAKKVELEDPDTKETFGAVRLVLIDTDGETLSFCSVGAVSSLDLIRAICGDGPWEHGLPIVCRREKTRAGRNIWRLKPMGR